MKKNFSQVFLFLAVLTLTVTTLWIYLSVHRALNKSDKPILTPQETKVLSPILDDSVFEELKKRNI
ncbi:hypothetical protein COT64_01085 [Candidatus Shapirobacteria bacterium CG09_land_8_20_14_0_10_39_12]|uniref:Uncharacterized protein n=1 Tax=Candidatus Shapirobacteria bacterium CG09_land_8_20_14_0_10_39_12 TaxID=1974885 RepID=A0A2H0WPZ1_9BACT|nr:MAG: hypothetical protein COT64_01085 [Candidatus Shapirobacteria bacterium CG09_land_8_20_14_0_10_39_12]